MRQRLGWVLGPALALATLVLPLGLQPQAQKLAAVFVLVAVFWVTEAIPLAATALLGPALAVLSGVAGAREVFAPFGHPILFLFIGSFFIARAMSVHGLDRRIALFVLSRRWVGERPGRILVAFGLVGAFLSMWMSNTATTAMMLPVGLGVLAALPEGEAGLPRRYATALMLTIAFSCEIGGIATPVGTPPNLIAIGMLEELLGRRISFLAWMSFGLPVAALCFVWLCLLLRAQYGVPRGRLPGAAERIAQQRARLGRWSRGEAMALAAFSLAVALWTLPGAAALLLGPQAPLTRALEQRLPEGPAAIVAASVLFVAPSGFGGRVLSWREAARIDWGTILLFGGGLSLGSLAFSTGLARAMGEALLAATGPVSLPVFALAALLCAMLVTEFMSNTATVNLLLPIVLALAAEENVPPQLPALAATIGCSLAFCLPVATPPNAIVYGSGHVRLADMLRTGLLLDAGCGLAVWAVLLASRAWLLA